MRNMEKDKRKNMRVAMNSNYFFFPDRENKRHWCTIKNISTTGSCITSNKDINTDDIIFLHMKGGEKNTDLKSRVVWAMDKSYGLEFFLETAEDFENISYIVNNLPLFIDK